MQCRTTRALSMHYVIRRSFPSRCHNRTVRVTTSSSVGKKREISPMSCRTRRRRSACLLPMKASPCSTRARRRARNSTSCSRYSRHRNIWRDGDSGAIHEEGTTQIRRVSCGGVRVSDAGSRRGCYWCGELFLEFLAAHWTFSE
jgi:hypothetical protein